MLLAGALCPSSMGYSATELLPPLPHSSPALATNCDSLPPFPWEDFPDTHQGICRYKALTQCHHCCQGTAGIHLGRHPALSGRNTGKNLTLALLSPALGSPWPWPSPLARGTGPVGERQCLDSQNRDIQRRKRVGWMEEPAGLPGQPAHTVKGVGAGSAQLWLQQF